jgi:hypothetical protein
VSGRAQHPTLPTWAGQIHLLVVVEGPMALERRRRLVDLFPAARRGVVFGQRSLVHLRGRAVQPSVLHLRPLNVDDPVLVAAQPQGLLDAPLGQRVRPAVRLEVAVEQVAE